VFNYVVPGTGDRKVRCTPALNFNTSQVGANGVAYFHCNDGKLYAVDATTGIPLSPAWPVNTGNNGNNGGPPPLGAHTQTWSSSPVIATDGRIYVGSANGHVYGFTPTGSTILDVYIGLPIEGSLVIGSNGWLFGGTREHVDYASNGTSGSLFAINPGVYTVGNPSQAIVWRNDNNGNGNPPGPLNYIASPVIDQAGFVYFTDFGHLLTKVHPTSGVLMSTWDIAGKACQTPAINQLGQLFVGSSEYSGDTFLNGNFAAFDLAAPGAPYWQITSGAGQTIGDLRGAVLIRATSTGRVYFADTFGRIYYFNSGAPLMAGDWPTFGGGSRRTGVVGQFPFAIAALPGTFAGVASAVNGLNVWGDAVGQTYGNWAYPNSTVGYYAARWQLTALTGYGSPTGYFSNSTANAINSLGAAAGNLVSTPAPLAWTDTSDVGVALTVDTTQFSLSTCVTKDIDSAGNIIGYGQRIGGGMEVLRWFRSGAGWGQAVPLAQPAGNAAYAYGLTDGALIAGKAKFTIGGNFHAAVGNAVNGFTFDLGTLGGVSSEAADLNDESGTVGWAHNSAGKQRAFFIENGATSLQTWHELPRLPGTTSTTYNSRANSVNRFGQVAGTIQNDANSSRAFRYTPGSGSEMKDLNTLTLQTGNTPAQLGWSLTEATALNDAGHLLGYGTRNAASAYWIIYPTNVE